VRRFVLPTALLSVAAASLPVIVTASHASAASACQAVLGPVSGGSSIALAGATATTGGIVFVGATTETSPRPAIVTASTSGWQPSYPAVPASIPPGTPVRLTAATSAGSEAYAVGFAATWPVEQAVVMGSSGGAFAPVATAATSGSVELYAAASASPGDLWVGGSVQSTHGRQALVQHLAGGAWTDATLPVTTAGNATVTGLATSGSTTVAVGYTQTPAGNRVPFAAHLTAGTWTLDPVAAPAPDTFFTSVVDTGGTLWAAGAFTGSQGTTQALIDRWTGSGWVTQRTAIPGADTVITALTASGADNVWAVGYRLGSASRAYVLHYDGSSWSLVRHTGIGAGRLLAAAVQADGTLAAGGSTSPGAGLIFGTSLCPTTIGTGGFSSSMVSAPLGTSSAWTVTAGSHDLVDGDGVGLVPTWSGTNGGGVTATFPAAGTFTVHDRSTGSTQLIQVAPTLTTSTSGTSVTWLSGSLPAGDVIDAQRQLPGGAWQNWVTGTTADVTTLIPVAGPGAYGVRARVRDVATGATSSWSPAVTATIS
jgi:hypothetical protein